MSLAQEPSSDGQRGATLRRQTLDSPSTEPRSDDTTDSTFVGNRDPSFLPRHSFQTFLNSKAPVRPPKTHERNASPSCPQKNADATRKTKSAPNTFPKQMTRSGINPSVPLSMTHHSSKGRKSGALIITRQNTSQRTCLPWKKFTSRGRKGEADATR